MRDAKLHFFWWKIIATDYFAINSTAQQILSPHFTKILFHIFFFIKFKLNSLDSYLNFDMIPF